MSELAATAAVLAFAGVFVLAMFKEWELTALAFGLALLVHGCEMMSAVPQ
jgi:hypothetical protein